MYVSSVAGTYRVLVFVMLQILYWIGFVYEVTSIMENHEVNGRRLTFSEAARYALINDLPVSQQEGKSSSSKSDDGTSNVVPEDECASSRQTSSAEEAKGSAPVETRGGLHASKRLDELDVKSTSTDAGSLFMDARKPRSSNCATLRERYLLGKLKAEFGKSTDVQTDKVDTDKYMYAAMYACLGVLLWRHLWVMHILVIPIVYYIVKQLGCYFGFGETIRCYYDLTMRTVESWCLERQQALLPSNIKGLYKLLVIVDEKVRDVLKGSVDAVATIAVILGLIVFTTCTTIFITIQVYRIPRHFLAKDKTVCAIYFIVLGLRGKFASRSNDGRDSKFLREQIRNRLGPAAVGRISQQCLG